MESTPELTPQVRRWALVLCLVAVGLRLTLLFVGPWGDLERAKTPDSARMVLLAENLRLHGVYGKPTEDGIVHEAVARIRTANGTLPAPDANGLRPESFRPPGYPALLALTQGAFGQLHWALLLQCLFGAALTWVVVSVGVSLGLSPRGALLAGLLWAVHPALVVHDTMFMTESLFNILAGAGLFAAARAPRPWNWVVSGALLGVAGLVRPLALLYEPLILALGWRRERWSWAGAILHVALALLPGGAWAWRNHAVGEGFRATTVPEINLLFYTTAYTVSEERNEDWQRTWPARVEELSGRLETRVAPGEDVIGAARTLAVEEVSARKKAFLKVQAKSGLKLVLDHSLEATYQAVGESYTPSGLFSRLALGGEAAAGSSGWTALVALGWVGLNALVALLALVGAVRGLRRRLFLAVACCVATLALFTLATGSVGIERMRLPMLLPLFLLAGLALSTPSGPRTNPDG